MQRHSSKRDAILTALRSTTAHPTAQEVWDILRETNPGISLSTVYRNLGEFVADGTAIRVPSNDGKDRFDGNINPHTHFVCSRCGRVTDIRYHSDPAADPAMDAEAEEMTGFKVHGHEVTFRGLCTDCLEAEHLI